MATQVRPVVIARQTETVAEGAVVRAEHLSKRFGDLRAVDDLSFSLERGTVTGFLGPNGAGKTTTLRMLLHLVEPTSGRAFVFGRRYQDLERPAARVARCSRRRISIPAVRGETIYSRSHSRSGATPTAGTGSSNVNGPRRSASTRCSTWSS